MKRSISILAIAGLMGTGFAVANNTTTGIVLEAGGDVGDVRLFRGNTNAALVAGDELLAGDRVVTMPGGSIELQYGDCRATVSQPGSFVIGSDVCAVAIEAAAQAPAPAGGAAAGGAAAGGAAAGVSTGVIVGGVVVAGGVIGGVAAAASGGGDDDEPASP